MSSLRSWNDFSMCQKILSGVLWTEGLKIQYAGVWIHKETEQTEKKLEDAMQEVEESKSHKKQGVHSEPGLHSGCPLCLQIYFIWFFCRIRCSSQLYFDLLNTKVWSHQENGSDSMNNPSLSAHSLLTRDFIEWNVGCIASLGNQFLPCFGSVWWPKV